MEQKSIIEKRTAWPLVSVEADDQSVRPYNEVSMSEGMDGREAARESAKRKYGCSGVREGKRKSRSEAY